MQIFINQLIANLQSKEIDVKRASIRELGRIRAKDAIEPLGNLLKEITDKNTRNMIVKALGKIGDRAAVPILLEQYDNLPSDAVNTAFIRLGLFDAVMPKRNDAMAKRERRKISITLRFAAGSLKSLVEQNKLTAEDILSALPPIL